MKIIKTKDETHLKLAVLKANLKLKTLNDVIDYLLKNQSK